jgi:beta-lactam-binding protein with PASTA domain
VSTREDWPTRELDRPERLVPEQTDELPSFAPPPARPRPDEARRAPGFGLGLLLGLLLAALALGAYLLIRQDEQDRTPQAAPPPLTKPGAADRTTVPRVVGYKETRALVVLGQAHLKSKIVERPTNQPTGVVVSQKPHEGAEVDRDTKVLIVVDAGAPPVSVPDLVGSEYADAAAALDKAGLEARRTTVASAEDPGTVVDQAPAAGKKIEKGASVVLSVARAEPVAVPNVVGRQASDAAAALRGAGFEARQYPVPSTQPNGTVVAQSPNAGTTREQGSRVRINVSTGATPTGAPKPAAGATGGTASVPDVVGLQATQAAGTFVQAGLLPSIVYVPSQEEAYVVVAQAKPPGKTLARGAHVQINVSPGPSPQADEPVPNVAGRAEEAARRTLTSAGFTVHVLELATSYPAQDGIVVEQQPGSGRSAPAGSPVTIFVGRAR